MLVLYWIGVSREVSPGLAVDLETEVHAFVIVYCVVKCGNIVISQIAGM